MILKISKGICLIVFLTLVFLGQIVNASEVTLQWDPNNPDPDGYRIYQRIEGQAYDYTKYKLVLHPEVTITITDLAPGVPYCWVARAFIGNDESGDSNEVCQKAPLKTTGERLLTEEEE